MIACQSPFVHNARSFSSSLASSTNTPQSPVLERLAHDDGDEQCVEDPGEVGEGGGGDDGWRHAAERGRRGPDRRRCVGGRTAVGHRLPKGTRGQISWRRHAEKEPMATSMRMGGARRAGEGTGPVRSPSSLEPEPEPELALLASPRIFMSPYHVEARRPLHSRRISALPQL